MLQGEHSAILLTFIKLPFAIKIFVLSIFERPFYTGFTVILSLHVAYMPSTGAWFDQTYDPGDVYWAAIVKCHIMYDMCRTIPEVKHK